MRSYPRNSPEAAARILTLAALADGNLSTIELATLERVDAYRQLGLDRLQMQDVLHGFCEDLLTDAGMSWNEVCQIAPATLQQLMGEIDEPALRLTLMNLCAAVIEADQLIAEGEAKVLLAALQQWGLQPLLHGHSPVPQLLTAH